MNVERWSIIVLIPVLLAFGALSWYLQLENPMVVDVSSLSRVPQQVERWIGSDVEMDSGVVAMLDADYNLQRTYIHPIGSVVWFYVGYYGTERGGRPEHTPDWCYPSNGWVILEQRVVNVGVDRKANEFVVERQGKTRLVHFWYQSSRASGLLGGLDQTLDRLLSRLSNGRADGSLVRLSTPIEDDAAAARQRLVSFGREIEPLLRNHWPTEVVSIAAGDSAGAPAG